jgi:chemotaxis protein MotB
MRIFIFLLTGLIFVTGFTGCSTLRKAKQADALEEENAQLKATIEDLQKVKVTKETKVSELEEAKLALERSLQKEISEYKAKLKMTERGLVISFLAEIFFDSGKDVVRTDAKPVLQKVAAVLKDKVADSYVAIEGHTDNQPIRHSTWKSNWELSSHRALAVLHYFIDSCGIVPTRLSAVGYGEFKPVAENDTIQNRQKNRRVEIIILPSKVNKIKAD